MIRSITFVLVGICLSACAKEPISVSTIYKSHQCTSTEAQFKQLKTRDEVSNFLTSASAMKFSMNAKTQDQDIAELDFESKHYLLISAGYKPSAGYQFKLTDSLVPIKDGEALLPLTLQTPDKDAMTAQVMTSPCIIVALDKGAYQKLRFETMELTLGE